MTQQLVSSGAPTSGDYHRSILRLLSLAGDQMSAQARESAYVSSELERLGCGLFNVSRGLDLRNENCFNTNAPAVDLLTVDRSLGVQITLDLNAAKVKKTIKKFRELTKKGGLLEGTRELWILGLRLSSRTDPPTWKNVDSDVVIGSFRSHLTLENLDAARLERIERSLLEITGCKITSAPDVRESLERIVEFMDRPAIYQYSRHEISWTRCMSALDAVALLINSGVKREDDASIPPVLGWTIPLPSFDPPTRRDLKDILKQLNAVQVAISKADPKAAILDENQSQLIDSERSKLRLLVNDFAKTHKISPPFPPTQFVG
ncbi:SMEK domain-containing protein [Pseudarthrobacter sp. BRE9]|uniref:SMEK domain-containing protein n=1 Tax=Pseudarthrobacter sp. BRE9 TaxID=2962582 RepID=UPI002881B972|nr:SMEK domain-containing protein [Pseudarthrobacter sp. BRE9]MDT0169748.1 SMEK domain-containing protein [Pseudarthrobacter sp. BRE9]